MDAEDGRAVELQLHLLGERCQEGLVSVIELRRAPLALVAQPRPGVAGQVRHPVEHPRIPVAEHDRAVETTQPLHRLARQGPGRDVSETDDPLDAGLLQLAEDGLEREQVAMQIRDQGQAHA